eukprot:TRINITY_DN3801_c0_g2_i19.p1 TRINITY_DN3801_c0_g2~~TRINITY_DN3801_c0_g2_i19.p1  ORF type:complete len:213 (+),score=42.93 TRINITY_DN3801_c0_g2_i19:1439-2077(+)
MIPSHFVVMEQFPYNLNNKVDHTKLPIPNEALDIETVEPYNALETKIRKIWSQTLGIDETIGGNSILSTKLTLQIQLYITRETTVYDVFTYPTVRELAALLANRSEPTQERIPKLNRNRGPASNVYLDASASENKTLYNVWNTYQFNGKLDVGKLRKAAKLLLQRHEIFRTVYEMDEKEGLIQIVLPSEQMEKMLYFEEVVLPNFDDMDSLK